VAEPDRERWSLVRQAIEDTGLDALVCCLAENIVLLSGYYSVTGASMAIFPRVGEPVLIAPRFEREFVDRGWIGDVREYDTWQNRYELPPAHLLRLARTVAEERGLRGGRIGIEGRFETIAPNGLSGEPTGLGVPGQALIGEAFACEPIDATELLYELRARKTAREIERLEIASEVASLGLIAFKEHAQPGNREVDVSAAVESAVRVGGPGYRGARHAFAWAQVTSGPATAGNWNYPLSSARRLERGDLVVIELGVVVDGYWSDLTRTVCAGTANQQKRDLFALVREAHAASTGAVRAGATGVEVDAAGRSLIAATGLGDAFVHQTGHGIGFRYHEPIPFVAPHSSHTLEAGHVHSIEPGVYIPGIGGCRIEDICVVETARGRLISHAEFDLA